jgi:hypothetical protein
MLLSDKSRQLILTSEGGKLIRFDTKTGRFDVLYEHSSSDYLFGIVCDGDHVYFSGCTFLGLGQIGTRGFELIKTVTPFQPKRGTYSRMMRSLWTTLGAHSKIIPYGKPDLHQMNQYGSTLYVAATSWNEIWLFDLDLQLKQRIQLQPVMRDYYHLNNVFCDGTHFYVCLNRYTGGPGSGGYAKFDLEWNEVERRAVGCESHALSVIDGQVVQLSCYSWRSEDQIRHPRKAGLMIGNDFVFEYDPQEYFCKDFSMDEECIYIIGGKNARRERRAVADGIVFVLNRRFELLEKHEIRGLGGLNGCRLRGTDHSRGAAPVDQDSSRNLC